MSNRHKHQYEFGRFAVDRSKRLLLCDGEIVPLQPKAFDTLLLLIERRGEVLTKDELLRQLWPDSFVEESNLSQNIYVLRKALAQTPGGDDLIKTVPKRGYRFVGNVREVSDNAELTIEEHSWTRVVTDEESYDDATVLPVEVAKQKTEVDHFSRPGTWSTVLSRRVILVTVGLGIITAFGAYGAWRINLRSRLAGSKTNESRAQDFQSMKIQRLTDIGKVLHPAISPDGKYLVYVLRDSTDKTSLWIKHIPSGSAKQIVESGQGLGDYEAPTFSPDSSFVYFIGVANGLYTLYRVPVLGGNPRKLIDDVWGRVALSPDGRNLAFVRVKWNVGEHTMFIANADGSAEHPVAERKIPKYFNVFGIGLVWSPDGKTIATSGGTDDGGNHDEVILVDVDTGAQRELADRKWRSMGQVAWLPDGKGLLVAAKEKAASPQQIWQVVLATGEAHRITNDLTDYDMLSITADGNVLLAQQSEQVSNLWVMTGDANVSHHGHTTVAFKAPDAVQITSATGRREGFYGIAWTPDLRIVYSSNAGGLYDLWIVKPDGSDPQRLTESTGESNVFPAVSPDGRYIVFSSDRSGENNIWRIDSDGRNAVQLTHGTNEYHSSFSADGQWVFYDTGQKSEVHEVPISGGESVSVIPGSAGHPIISPDGKLVAYTYYDEQQKEPWRLGVMRLDDNVLSRSWPQPFRCYGWTPGTLALTSIVGENTVSNLWSRPLDGTAPTQLTDFKEKRLYWFEWSPNGKYIALARGEWSSDVVAISGVNFLVSGGN